MKDATNAVTVLIAEDDDGHAELIRSLLEEVGVHNPTERLRDGQDVLDFFKRLAVPPQGPNGERYLLLLDIRMPRVDGVQVLEFLKAHSQFKTIPVIMLTTTDDPREIQRCYELGCNSYVTKPVAFEQFTAALKQLGLFLLIMQIPKMTKNGTS